MNSLHVNEQPLEYLRRTRKKLKWLLKIRPNTLAGPLYRLLSPFDRRVVVEVEGIHFACDPLSFTSGEILDKGTYEPDTISMLRRHVRPGQTFIDIGANEGFLSSVAASLVGPTGTVIAVEPQSEVSRVLSMNVAMNARGRWLVLQRALDVTDDIELTINLSPYVNTGGSSIVRRAKFAKRELVRTISFATIMKDCELTSADFVKIDVEGYEPEVVQSIEASGWLGKIGILAVDYHAAILAHRGIDPRNVEKVLLDAGMRRVESEAEFSGFTLYSKQ